MTESVAKPEKKILTLDLDTNASPKQIILTQSELKNSKTHDSSANPIKIKKGKESGSDKPKKAKATSDTSIIDSILKKNKVDPAKISAAEPQQKDKSIQEQKKKMILDLNSGEQIITANISPTAKISDMGDEPKLQFVPEKPKATIILKSEAKKQKQTGGTITPPETQFKLDTLFSIDNSLAQTQASQPAYAPPEYNQNFETPPYPPPSYQTLTSTDTTQNLINKSQSITTTPHVIDYAKELTEIDAQLAKIRAKLAKRGPEPKYLEMQTKLEERRAKYIRRQQRQEACSSKAKPGQIVSPETVNKITKSPIQSVHNLNYGSTQLFKKVKSNSQIITTQPDLLDEVNMELRKAKDMLTNIEQSHDATGINISNIPTPGRKVIKEQGTSIFAVPNELTSMREKKEHLLAEQKKISERIAHRQKQIDKIKTWQREVERMQELQAEKQRIFELQQDLKRLERQQYEQDQKLKGQMYQIRKMAHSKSNELKRLDMIDTFKAVKMRSQSVPVANNTQIQSQTYTQTHMPDINSSSATTQSGFGGKLRAAINELFSGERVMFTKNNTIPAPIKQVEPQAPIIITEDAKSGLEYRTATPVNDDTALDTSSTLPAQKIVDVINMAKQIDDKSSEPETRISQYQVNVFRDYFCDKVGISKKGISKCFDLMPNKDEKHTAILVNAYKELCDEIRFSG